MTSFTELLPKAELHAHLNGSISAETLQRLIEDKKRRTPSYDAPLLRQICFDKPMSMNEAFKIFPIIHDVTDSMEAIYQATSDVIREFSQDNVKYLELRTTPKSNLDTGLTKKTYVSSVLRAIEDCKKSGLDILVKLLLSIDRKRGLENAMETVELAERFSSANHCVVGIDLSGDPSVNGVEFVDVLTRAKNNGLKTTLHMAEQPNTLVETFAFLQLPPDRIGHGTYLFENDTVYEKVAQMKIPIEICLTSNVKCLTVDSFDNHHFKRWFSISHPLALCTDDKGIFQTSLSNEFQIAAETFNLSNRTLFEISKNSLEFAFIDQETKSDLERIWNEFSNACSPDFEKVTLKNFYNSL